MKIRSVAKKINKGSLILYTHEYLLFITNFRNEAHFRFGNDYIHKIGRTKKVMSLTVFLLYFGSIQKMPG